MGKIGMTEILLVLVVVVLLFGGRKIPELMKGIGQGMKEFKKASKFDPANEDNRRSKQKTKSDYYYILMKPAFENAGFFCLCRERSRPFPTFIKLHRFVFLIPSPGNKSCFFDYRLHLIRIETIICSGCTDHIFLNHNGTKVICTCMK